MTSAIPSPSSTVRDCVYAVMRDFGADTIFGNPGSTELPMFRDFPADFKYVLGLQEAVCVGMADGYAQANGKVVFVNLHSAAGVGNAMGNIHTAFKNRTPMVIVAGQQTRSILQFDPYLASEQATELPKPYVKWSIEPARAEDVPQAIATACHRALQAPCGPVLVSVPSDDWDRPAKPVLTRKVSHRTRPDPAILTEVTTALARSERPAFVVGAEVDRDGAWNEVVQLAERHSAAVYNAPMSARAGFPEDHRLFAGFLPAVREQIVQRLAGHDFVLVIGAPVFTYHVEGEGPHLPDGVVLCQLTEDADGAARSPVGTSVVGGVQLALRDLLAADAPPKRALPPARLRVPHAEPDADRSGRISVAWLLQTLADLRSPEDVIVEEAPTARVVMHAHLPILRPGTFYTMASGGLGYGMPAAAGVALAQPDRRVIGLIGDGSSMYSIQTLWTAAQLGLDMTFVIVNNRRYAALKRFGGVLGFPADAVLPGTDLPGLDFVALAQGHGVRAERVQDAAKLRTALEGALESKGPSLVEVLVA
ncbi:benzoylformate decarboxylase [Variovorax beijingensis]|uniref:Benzoylformate decarboxylase n=1 Tax=Variovorax beijingensis TaxID=2496117 RepID=A0A3P3EVM7_9BURK|nr:benzoylformate decarboxylase [Variovorax beijingensis]RRH90311.1 benzoylformate decarboxylase [Variovorax beijingensis]